MIALRLSKEWDGLHHRDQAAGCVQTIITMSGNGLKRTPQKILKKQQILSSRYELLILIFGYQILEN